MKKWSSSWLGCSSASSSSTQKALGLAEPQDDPESQGPPFFVSLFVFLFFCSFLDICLSGFYPPYDFVLFLALKVSLQSRQILQQQSPVLNRLLKLHGRGQLSLSEQKFASIKNADIPQPACSKALIGNLYVYVFALLYLFVLFP